MWVDPNVFVLTNCILILITTEHSTKEQGGEYNEDNRHNDCVAISPIDAERLRVRGRRGWGGTGLVAVKTGAPGFTFLQRQGRLP